MRKPGEPGRARLAFVGDDGHVYVDEGDKFVVRYVPQSEAEGLRLALTALAKWTQHSPDCKRALTTAEFCSCGLQEAWAEGNADLGAVAEVAKLRETLRRIASGEFDGVHAAMAVEDSIDRLGELA